MRAKTLTTMGSLHPVLFFAGVYAVALVFSIFICSSLFYSCNANSTSTMGSQKSIPADHSAKAASTTVALR